MTFLASNELIHTRRRQVNVFTSINKSLSPVARQIQIYIFIFWNLSNPPYVGLINNRCRPIVGLSTIDFKLVGLFVFIGLVFSYVTLIAFLFSEGL